MPSEGVAAKAIRLNSILEASHATLQGAEQLLEAALAAGREDENGGCSPGDWNPAGISIVCKLQSAKSGHLHHKTGCTALSAM